MTEKDFTRDRIKEALDNINDTKALATIWEVVRSFTRRQDR